MAVVISVANQKGGIGKTTPTLNLGYGLEGRASRAFEKFTREVISIVEGE